MAREQKDIDYLLDTIIPYRLYCLYGLDTAIELKTKGLGADRGQFQMSDGEKVYAHGNAAGVINPMLEAGIVHGRALLEFLGLWATENALKERPKKYENDWHITDLDLKPVTRAQAIAAYQGEPKEAEESLLSIMIYANRAIAHMTDLLDPERFGSYNFQIAARGIHALVSGYVYAPLDRKRPEWGKIGV